MLLQRYPDYLKPIMWFGLFLCSLSLLLSSFVSHVSAILAVVNIPQCTHTWSSSSQVVFLVLLHGVGLGIGGGLLYWPIMILVSEWFVQRRGLAGGIIFAGSGVGGKQPVGYLRHLDLFEICHSLQASCSRFC